jgi:hypothetical protein
MWDVRGAEKVRNAERGTNEQCSGVDRKDLIEIIIICVFAPVS